MLRSWNSDNALVHVWTKCKPSGYNSKVRIIIPLLFLMVIPFSLAYGSEITYRSPVPIWYSFDCSDPSPTVFTKTDPSVSQFKYFSYFFHGKCYVVLNDFDVSGLSELSGTTIVTSTVDTRGSLITNTALSNQYTVPCNLMIINNPDILSGALILTPQNYNAFTCTVNSANRTVSTAYNFTSPQITNFENNIKAGNQSFSIMVLPRFNATMQSNLNNNSYEYGIQNLQDSLYVNGNGFNCALISGSGMCDFLDKPWKAVAIAFGADYIGPWFYVLAFLPFPISTYLITRNGTYAGFIGVGFMLTVSAINQMIFETALTMILICAAFGFYEVIKRLNQ